MKRNSGSYPLRLVVHSSGLFQQSQWLLSIMTYTQDSILVLLLGSRWLQDTNFPKFWLNMYLTQWNNSCSFLNVTPLIVYSCLTNMLNPWFKSIKLMKVNYWQENGLPEESDTWNWCGSSRPRRRITVLRLQKHSTMVGQSGDLLPHKQSSDSTAHTNP